MLTFKGGYKMEIGTSYLQEYNYMSRYEDTHFYMSISTKPIKYGVCINIKDIANSDQIIEYFKNSEKKRLEGWRKDLLQTKYIKLIIENNPNKENEYFELLMRGGNKTQWIKDNIYKQKTI